MGIDRGSGNIAIESFILGGDARNWQHEFIKNDAVPCCDITNKKIYSPIFGTIINEHDDMMVRGKNEHEAGHARLTPQDKDPKWSGLKANLVNALEDLRIERSISKLSPVIEKDLHGMNQELNRSLNLKLSQEEGKNIKPVDEAILVMMFRENGLSVCWDVSESAQKYFDAAYPEFQKWRDISNADNKAGFYEIENVADKVIEKLEESAKEQNQQEEGNQNQKNQKNNKNENQGNNQQENNQRNSSEENENSGSSKNNKEKTSDEKSETSSKNNEEKENSNETSSKNNDDNNEEEMGSSDSGNDKEESSNNQTGENKDNDDDNGKGNFETSDNMDGENNENGKPQKEIGSNDEETKELKANNKKEQKKAQERLEKDFGGKDVLKEELSEKMKKILEDSQKISSGYTSFTANDMIIKGEEKKDSFETARKSISSVVGQLSNYTEDAIKALSRVQMQRNLEHGKIDRHKLVGLSKSLTKKVFYKSKPGIDLNTAITIMIDESGSIGYMCYELRALAIAFSEVFTKLNIRFEVLGYTTHNNIRYNTPKNVTRTAPIKIIEHKTFGETYQQAKYRLGSISSDYCNIDGESLLIAYKRIAKERVNRRIIFVLSDGLPNQGWGSSNITRHLYDSIRFIRKNGTEVYGFGIGTEEPKKFYGEDNFLYLRNVSELGTAFFRRFREIVAR